MLIVQSFDSGNEQCQGKVIYVKKNHKLGEITRKLRWLNDRRLSILSLKRNYSLFWMFILKQNFCDFPPCSMSMLMLTDVPPSKRERQAWQLFSATNLIMTANMIMEQPFQVLIGSALGRSNLRFSTIWVTVVQGAVLCPCCELVNSWLSAQEPAM